MAALRLHHTPNPHRNLDSSRRPRLKNKLSDKAEREFRQVLNGRRRILGDEHLDTLRTWTDLARVLAKQELFAAAETEYRQLLPLQRRVLGDAHPKTLETWSDLAHVLSRQGRPEEAAEEYDKQREAQRHLHQQEHPDDWTESFRQNTGAVDLVLGRVGRDEPPPT